LSEDVTAANDFDEECRDLILSLLGEHRVAELNQAMLDIGVRAVNLPHEEDGDVVRLRDAAFIELGTHERILDRVTSPVPWYFERMEPRLAVLVAGMNRQYLEVPVAVSNHVNADSRVGSALPALADRFDDDGLLDVAALSPNGYGLIFDGHALHYHQFLRRGLLGNMNDGLVSILLAVARRDGNKLRIAIDDRRLTTSAEMRHTIEEEFWHGPPLTETWLDDPYKGGTTVYRYPEEAFELDLGYEAIFSYWRMNGPREKVVQIEELTALDVQPVAGLQCLRYLHAIRDIESGNFIHCDGAVRGYAPDELNARRNEAMPTATRAERYRKVFRIDGIITTEEWSEIATKWYQGNRLVEEYLKNLGQTLRKTVLPDEKGRRGDSSAGLS
jgi:hypothetical protein